MAYSELIKNFKSIRSYMRAFYVYGFKCREEYDAKSARSYDNERRRMESWLGDYMLFRQDASGKQVFLSVDSRNVQHNPLYQAFKAKSFTRGDLLLHFFLLDLLADGNTRSVGEITRQLDSQYLYGLDGDFAPDESTVRKKLREYQELGLLRAQKQGRELAYCRSTDAIDPARWQDAIAFFSEAAPLGVVGSFLLDRQANPPGYFGFKHHYMLHALDSEILLALLDCMNQQRFAVLEVVNSHRSYARARTVFPLKIFVSTQTGRQYLLAQPIRTACVRVAPVHLRNPIFIRLDNIQSVQPGETAQKNADRSSCERFMRHLWGVSAGPGKRLEHLEMTVRAGKDEPYIVERLAREKRCGTVTVLDGHTYRFVADVYDAMEMLPWIRTFIGRIKTLTCSNTLVTDTFYADLEAMQALYGGDDHAVP